MVHEPQPRSKDNTFYESATGHLSNDAGVVGTNGDPTKDGTVISGLDHSSTSVTPSFTDGNTGYKTSTISVSDDALLEGNETLNLSLSSPTRGTVHGSLNEASLIIAAKDAAVDVNRDGYVEEGDLRTIVANLGSPPFDVPGANLNGDNVVDVLDLSTVALNLGRLAPQPLRAMRVERAFSALPTFQRLTNLVQPDDGHNHIFVTEQAGVIYVFPNSQRATQASIFLDIRDRVNAFPAGNNEEGLLGLAFDPDYRNNGRFYVYYSSASPLCSTTRCSMLSRFSVSSDDPNLADPQSELIVMEIGQPAGNHNGGQLAFGPDGYLYIGLGDGGGSGDHLGNGQNRDTLLGSVLRIDMSGGPNYRVPSDNPFVGVAGARDEIWAYGLRNPWRFSFDRHTGMLWLADVGQNDWEEIDILEGGLNYGWNIMEGRHCYPAGSSCDQTDLKLPLWEYSHSAGDCSVTGAYVYRGRGMASVLGAYVYGDFCTGKIWGLRYDGVSVTEQMLLVDSTLAITSFGEDLAHNLYILSFIFSADTGIFRLVPIDSPPLALSRAEVGGLTVPGIKSALEDLQQRLGVDLGLTQIERMEQVTWRDTSLGCPDPGMVYAQVLTPGIWLVLSYRGQEYDYRIANSLAVLCAQTERRDPLDRKPLEGVWSRLAPVPTPRSEVAAATMNGKIYVFGGFGSGATANEEYDPLTNTWRGRAPIPRGVNHAAAQAFGGKIYLIGGFDGSFRPVDTVWAYDPEIDAWTRKADLPTPRGALGASVVKGKIYAIGGRGFEGDVGTTEEYDPATDTWRTRSLMPTPRDHIAISVVDDKIYVIGGRLGTFTSNLGDNEEYDPVTDTWANLAPFPTARSGITSAVVDGQVYVFGGESGDGTFVENERYDPSEDTWEPMPALPTARHGLAAVELNNRIYVLAGGTAPGGSRSAINEVFIVLSPKKS